MFLKKDWLQNKTDDIWLQEYATFIWPFVLPKPKTALNTLDINPYFSFFFQFRPDITAMVDWA